MLKEFRLVTELIRPSKCNFRFLGKTNFIWIICENVKSNVNSIKEVCDVYKPNFISGSQQKTIQKKTHENKRT